MSPRDDVSLRSALRLAAVVVAAAVIGFAPLPIAGAQSAVAEGPDVRAELDVLGRVNEISPAPNGRVWLTTALGKTYFADGISAPWKYGSALGKATGKAFDFLLGPSLDRITFVSDEVAIMTGYVDSGANYYRTTDGGKSWSLLKQPTDEWIYDVYGDARGELWMGGSAGGFAHSRDAGLTWEKKKPPFDQSTRTHAIFMVDPLHGYVGSLSGNALRYTDDGGSTWRKVPTPLDQKQIVPASSARVEERIERIRAAGGRLFVSQGGRVFVTDAADVRWQPLSNVPLRDFDIDLRTGAVFVIATDLAVGTLGPDLQFRTVPGARLYAEPVSLKTEKGAAFILDAEGGVYEVGEVGMTFTYPFTMDHPIRNVSTLRSCDGRFWGATAHHLYGSDAAGAWYRLASTHFAIQDFVCQSADQILLWDGHGHNARYRRGGEIVEVEELEHRDVIRVLAGDPFWVAFGGMQFETTRRVDVARTFVGGQFQGSVGEGFVYVSRDRGASWLPADHWSGGGVANLYLRADGTMYLLSYLGSVRRLDPSPGGWQAKTLVEADDERKAPVPYSERSFAFLMRDDASGFASGDIHHVGLVCNSTKDGGRSWSSAACGPSSYLAVIPYGSRHIASTGRRLFILSSRPDELLLDLDRIGQAADVGIQAVSADGEAVIACLSSGHVLRFDPATKKWMRVESPVMGREKGLEELLGMPLPKKPAT